jgi:transcriptional regulator with XRE-family HTH domain
MRAARALLGWSREDLSNASGVPVRTLARVESGEPHRFAAYNAALSALEDAGIEFIAPDNGGEGARRRAGQS